MRRIVGQIAQPGPLGPLHGDDGRPRRHRHARDAAGRHADRHRQARPARASRRSPSRPPTSSTTPAPSAPSTARPSVIDSFPTWLMVVSPSKGTFHRAEQAGAATVLEPGAAHRRRREHAATRPRSRRPTAARSWSGWSRTATWSRPASPSCASTRREQPDGHDQRPTSGAQHAADPRHRQLPPLAGRPERRHRRRDRLQRRVDPAALRHPAAPVGRRPRRPCR